MKWYLPNYEPFIGAHYCLWYRGDWTNSRVHGSRTEYTPIRGSYQSSDEKVIREHVEEAKGHGINVFVCSWMPPEKGRRKVTPLEVSPWNAVEPNYEDENLAKLVDIAEELQDFYVVVILEWNRLREEFMEDTTYALYREDTKGIGINGKPLPYPALTRSATLTRSGTLSTVHLKKQSPF